MGLQTAFRKPTDTPPLLALETMSVDELVNIIKEEEGLTVNDDDNDVELHLSLSHDDCRERYHNQVSPPSVVEDTNDGDTSSNNENSDDSDGEDDDCDDISDDGKNDSRNNRPYPPPFYPYPHYHYPMPPPPHHPYPSHMPPPDHHPSSHNPYLSTSQKNPHVYTDASTMTDPAPDTRRNRGGVTEPFPEKLHRMLDAVEREGLSDVVSFFSHGRAFAIHKPRRFVSDVMLRFFRQTRLTSFQRQLNLYGFRRISTGPDNGGYYHELFLKGRPGLCVNMKRTKVKGTSKLKRDPDTEPNFYAMRPIAPGAPPPPPSANNGPGGGGGPPNAPYYPPFPYGPPPPPPPPSYPPYTAAQNGSMHPPPPPGYYPPPPYAAPYHYPPYHYPPPPSLQERQMQKQQRQRPLRIQSYNSLDHDDDSDVDDDFEVPALPEVTEDDV